MSCVAKRWRAWRSASDKKWNLCPARGFALYWSGVLFPRQAVPRRHWQEPLCRGFCLPGKDQSCAESSCGYSECLLSQSSVSISSTLSKPGIHGEGRRTSLTPFIPRIGRVYRHTASSTLPCLFTIARMTSLKRSFPPGNLATRRPRWPKLS